MKQYKNYINHKRKELINYSKKVESKVESFKRRLEVINIKTKSLIKMEHNPLEIAKDSYLWFTYNQMLLEEKMANNGEYATLFITLTLPSSYHKYSSYTKNYNSKYNKEHTIRKGYELLNNSFRAIYKDFKVNRKHQKIFFSKVVEPHKDLTCHLHSILYVKKDYLENLKNHILKVIKRNELGRYDIDEIKDITRGTSYLLKYIQKNTNPKNDEDFHFFNGWKKKYGIRVFTHSNIELERYIFKKVNSVLKLSKGLENKNPITEVLNQCNITINIKSQYSNDTRVKRYTNLKKQRYEVVIEKTKITNYRHIDGWYKKDSNKRNFSKRILINDIVFEHCTKLEIVQTYKINKFIIKDTLTNEILYDKSDYMMLDDYNLQEYLKI